MLEWACLALSIMQGFPYHSKHRLDWRSVVGVFSAGAKSEFDVRIAQRLTLRSCRESRGGLWSGGLDLLVAVEVSELDEQTASCHVGTCLPLFSVCSNCRCQPMMVIIGGSSLRELVSTVAECSPLVEQYAGISPT